MHELFYELQLQIVLHILPSLWLFFCYKFMIKQLISIESTRHLTTRFFNHMPTHTTWHQHVNMKPISIITIMLQDWVISGIGLNTHKILLYHMMHKLLQLFTYAWITNTNSDLRYSAKATWYLYAYCIVGWRLHHAFNIYLNRCLLR